MLATAFGDIASRAIPHWSASLLYWYPISSFPTAFSCNDRQELIPAVLFQAHSVSKTTFFLPLVAICPCWTVITVPTWLSEGQGITSTCPHISLEMPKHFY